MNYIECFHLLRKMASMHKEALPKPVMNISMWGHPVQYKDGKWITSNGVVIDPTHVGELRCKGKKYKAFDKKVYPVSKNMESFYMAYPEARGKNPANTTTTTYIYPQQQQQQPQPVQQQQQPQPQPVQQQPQPQPVQPVQQQQQQQQAAPASSRNVPTIVNPASPLSTGGKMNRP